MGTDAIIYKHAKKESEVEQSGVSIEDELKEIEKQARELDLECTTHSDEEGYRISIWKKPGILSRLFGIKTPIYFVEKGPVGKHHHKVMDLGKGKEGVLVERNYTGSVSSLVRAMSGTENREPPRFIASGKPFTPTDVYKFAQEYTQAIKEEPDIIGESDDGKRIFVRDIFGKIEEWQIV